MRKGGCRGSRLGQGAVLHTFQSSPLLLSAFAKIATSSFDLCPTIAVAKQTHGNRTEVSIILQDARRRGAARRRVAAMAAARGRLHRSRCVQARLWCMMQCAGQPDASPSATSLQDVCKMLQDAGGSGASSGEREACAPGLRGFGCRLSGYGRGLARVRAQGDTARHCERATSVAVTEK